MPRQTYDLLLRSLSKGELAPVYYLSGPEDALKEEAARSILDLALDPSWRDFNFEQRSAGQLDPEELHTLLNTLPMMAGRRVVFLREIEALKKKAKARAVLLKYLEHPSEELVLVLLESAGADQPEADLARLAFAVHVGALTPERVAKWLLLRAKAAGVIFAEGAAEHLAVACDYHLASIKIELEKLGASMEGTPVTVEGVANLVGVRHGETLWDWRDAVLGDDPARALRLLGPVLDQTGMLGVKLVTTLGTSLVGVSLAAAHYQRGLRGGALEGQVFDAMRRARPIGLPNWREEAHRWSAWARAWPAARLKAALRATLQTDQALKSTRISDERGLVTDLVLQLTVWKREAA